MSKYKDNTVYILAQSRIYSQSFSYTRQPNYGQSIYNTDTYSTVQ